VPLQRTTIMRAAPVQAAKMRGAACRQMHRAHSHARFSGRQQQRSAMLFSREKEARRTSVSGVLPAHGLWSSEAALRWVECPTGT
jgi:hypothetical protein